jgi:hypothetical protein
MVPTNDVKRLEPLDQGILCFLGRIRMVIRQKRVRERRHFVPGFSKMVKVGLRKQLVIV